MSVILYLLSICFLYSHHGWQKHTIRFLARLLTHKRTQSPSSLSQKSLWFFRVNDTRYRKHPSLLHTRGPGGWRNRALFVQAMCLTPLCIGYDLFTRYFSLHFANEHMLFPKENCKSSCSCLEAVVCVKMDNCSPSIWQEVEAQVNIVDLHPTLLHGLCN